MGHSERISWLHVSSGYVEITVEWLVTGHDTSAVSLLTGLFLAGLVTCLDKLDVVSATSQASAAVELNFSVFWVVTRNKVV
jgi:hypothetical protein